MKGWQLTPIALAALATVADAATVITSPFRGVTHYERTEPAGVVAPRRVVMNILEIELNFPGISFLTTPGNGDAPGEFTGQRTSQFVAQHNLQIGMNGDFYSSAGTGPNGEIYRDVTNLAASNGSLISPWPASPGSIRGAVNVSAGNVPTLVRPPSGSGGTFNTTPSVSLYNAIGGSDRMIENGNIILTSNFANEVHPRTVIGYNATRLYLFTVDGRQPGYSEGMNLHEIANVLKNDYGVTHALNLDGGGSTTMVLADPTVRVVNRPSDGTERVNGNNFGVFAPHWPTWSRDGGGNWSVATNWNNGPPNGVGAAAKFANNNTTTRTVTVNVPVTLGTLRFESNRTWQLGGTQPITFDASTGAASVTVSLPAVQTINAPVVLADPLILDVIAGATLNLNGSVANASGRSITKTGGGTLFIGGAQDHGAGTILTASAGALTLNRNLGSAASALATLNLATGATAEIRTPQNVAAVQIAGGATASVTPGGGNTIKTRSLAVSGAGSKLDLTNNTMVIDYTGASPIGSWTGSAYTGMTGLVARGRNGGAWNGEGITSSTAAASAGLTGLGIAEASEILGLSGGETATWAGQVVDATSLLIAHTYAGDANLDGVINIDDYGQIDFHVGLSGLVFGYFKGDFNYDGLINIDDYGIIDFNVGLQSISPAAAEAAAVAVPEPAGWLLVLPVLGVRLHRRRRRRGSAQVVA